MRQDTNDIGSDRTLGLMFACLSVAGAFWKRHDSVWLIAFLAAATAILVVSLIAAHLLRPINVGWHLLGLWIGWIVTPFVMAVLFFAIVTPIAIGLRWFSKDLLRLKRQSGGSYWIERVPMNRTDMTRQF